ncbi:MAG: acyltransferase [Balneolaceae bacterium]|nr:acyltransferase [Balneolaceae bacterium]
MIKITPPGSIGKYFFQAFAKVEGLVQHIKYMIRYKNKASSLKKLGKEVIIDYGVIISHANNVSIGDGTFIGKDTIIISRNPVYIGSGVGIAAGCRLITWNHDINNQCLSVRNMPQTDGKIVLNDGVWLGYNVVILPGITMGKGAVAAAGAIVTKDVPPFTIVGGIPAKPIGKRMA